jgi:nicotinamide-nucleotide amidase
VIASELIDALRRNEQSLSVAESLTGGLLASALIDIPGASDVFSGGVVAYTAQAKREVLGVHEEALAHGVVSQEVAIAMAQGALELFGSDYALSTTGIAGPGPQEGQEPGTIWLGCASKTVSGAILVQLAGDRNQIRVAAVSAALAMIDTQVVFSRLHQHK